MVVLSMIMHALLALFLLVPPAASTAVKKGNSTARTNTSTATSSPDTAAAESALASALASTSASADDGSLKGDAAPTSPQPKGPWYEGLDGVKVLRPTDANLQAEVDAIFKEQSGWTGHFNQKRYAILLTPGEYPEDFVVPIAYYTTVSGVGKEPSDVKIKAIQTLNGPNGHATDNFWRSFEGITLTNASVTWAVSQGASARRAAVEGHLYLSDGQGYSSGGFLADIKMKGTIMAGMQQQWLFRNLNMPGGVYCPTGWNYVFVGVKDMVDETYAECAGATTGKVTMVSETPRIAEKPYLIKDGDSWQIAVPQYVSVGTVGAIDDHEAAIARKLDVDTEVFVAKPGHTEKDINEGIRGKKGLLITPGVYELEEPVVIDQSDFVVLGLGLATLVPTKGKPALEVSDGLSDVRIAGLLLDAGTPMSEHATEPMLRWGAKGEASRRLSDDSVLLGGVLSDVFARIGAFKFRDCSAVRADTMIEVSSDDVLLDNVWLWHADHDDCGTDPGNSLDVTGPSDDCYSKHGLVVTGDRVTAYGVSAEHMIAGDMVLWKGNDGEAYFYQCELPYHNDGFSAKGYVGYAVAPEVTSHKARGMGIYIISAKGVAKGAYRLPPSTDAKNLITVVVIGKPSQFANTLCLPSEDGENSGTCFQAETCVPDMRCLLPSMPASDGAVRLFLDGPSTPRARASGAVNMLASSAGVSMFVLGIAILVWRGAGGAQTGSQPLQEEVWDGAGEGCE